MCWKSCRASGNDDKKHSQNAKGHASNLNANGVPLDCIREMLGHSTLSITLGYIYKPAYRIRDIQPHNKGFIDCLQLSSNLQTQRKTETLYLSTFPHFYKSARRDSNPRPRPWQGRAPPTEPLAHLFIRSNRTNITIHYATYFVNSFFNFFQKLF